jgi:hypothetical protein
VQTRYLPSRLKVIKILSGRMRREPHVRFCAVAGVRSLSATRLYLLKHIMGYNTSRGIHSEPIIARLNAEERVRC